MTAEETWDGAVSADEGLLRAIECLLFAAGEPLSAKTLARTLETNPMIVYEAVRALRDRYARSGLQIVESAGRDRRWAWGASRRPSAGAYSGRVAI